MILGYVLFQSGLTDLTRDNSTEHGHTINILERMNIYQEVFLAWLYRSLNLQYSIPAILFYVYFIFKFTGFYLAVIFITAWYLAKSWMAGCLAALLFIVLVSNSKILIQAFHNYILSRNLVDTTRVTFSINLRESFALPLLFSQVFVILVYLERKEQKSPHPTRLHLTMVSSDLICLALILFFTWLFALMWQFNQFILLLQAFSLYGLFVLQLAPRQKIRNILIATLLGLLLVEVMQFCHPMILGSLFVAFVPSAVLMMWLQRNFTLTGGILDGSLKIVFQVLSVLFCTFLTNWLIKSVIDLEADQHIFKFIKVMQYRVEVAYMFH